MDASRLERIRPAIEKHIGDARLSGAITLVSRRGEVVHEECYGLMDRETRRPMRSDALFRIYSMTKPITCVALMTLFERGLVRLADPVASWIPELGGLKVLAGGTASDPRLVEPARPVTVRDLLTHTAGFTYHFNEYGPVEQMYRDALPQEAPLAEYVAAIARLPLAFQPGTCFRYSVAHDVAGRLIEVVSGDRLDRYIDKNVLRPLAMLDTGYFVPEEKLDRFVSMYGAGDVCERRSLSRLLSERALAGENRLLAGPRDSLQSQEHAIFRGGVGLVSSARDYLRFCRMLLEGGELDGARILGRKTIELMTANHLAPALLPYELGGRSSPGWGFGLGMRVMMDPAQAQTLGSVGEYGWAGAAGTYFWIDPREQLIGILMAQHQPGGLFPTVADFRATAYQAIAD
jgi:CubicO group peptidase (beta-lactamase class C family)